MDSFVAMLCDLTFGKHELYQVTSSGGWSFLVALTNKLKTQSNNVIICVMFGDRQLVQLRMCLHGIVGQVSFLQRELSSKCMLV